MDKTVQTFIVAGVVIKQDEKYLLVQENRPGDDKVHGLWNFPAGVVDEGYTIEETAVKEAKEESGYEVELIRKLDIFQDSVNTPPKHAFEAKIIGGSLNWPKDEILDAKWFTWQEIKGMGDKLRSEWIIGSIAVLEEETFEKEFLMCQGLSKKNGGKCNWGECEKCGVIPLLYKLAKGEVYEKEGEINKLKNNILK